MQLVGLKGIHWTQTFPVVGPEVTIGREAANSIVCDGDSRVSRRHARLAPGGLSYQIEDLGSSNGTFVNGVRIAGPTPLIPGDEITIGGQSYRFEDLSPQPPSPYTAPPAIAPSGARPREVSRGEQARMAQPALRPPQRDMLRGCAMPDFNLPDAAGCLRVFVYLLLALAIVMVLGGLLMLAGMGIGAVGGAFGHHGGPGPSAPAGGNGGQPSGQSTGGGGSSGDQGSGQPAQPGESIHIHSVHVEQTWHAALQHSAPRILISWDNLTHDPVHKITAIVTTLDEAGHPLVTTKNVVIYDGKPVAPDGSHDDTVAAGDGIDPPGGGYPASATIDVTSWE